MNHTLRYKPKRVMRGGGLCDFEKTAALGIPPDDPYVPWPFGEGEELRNMARKRDRTKELGGDFRFNFKAAFRDEPQDRYAERHHAALEEQYGAGPESGLTRDELEARRLDDLQRKKLERLASWVGRARRKVMRGVKNSHFETKFHRANNDSHQMCGERYPPMGAAEDGPWQEALQFREEQKDKWLHGAFILQLPSNRIVPVTKQPPNPHRWNPSTKPAAGGAHSARPPAHGKGGKKKKKKGAESPRARRGKARSPTWMQRHGERVLKGASDAYKQKMARKQHWAQVFGRGTPAPSDAGSGSAPPPSGSRQGSRLLQGSRGSASAMSHGSFPGRSAASMSTRGSQGLRIEEMSVTSGKVPASQPIDFRAATPGLSGGGSMED